MVASCDQITAQANAALVLLGERLPVGSQALSRHCQISQGKGSLSVLDWPD
jgi:hypothetical protein